VASFITTVVLSRYLEAAMTGWFFYVLAWLTFFVLIASMGMDIAITYTVSSGKFNGSSVFTAIILWVIFCIVVSGLTEWLMFSGLKKVSTGTFTLFIAGQLLILFFSAYFFGEKKFILPSFIQVAGNLIFSLYCIFYFENISRVAGESLSFIFFLYALVVFLQGFYLLCHFIFRHKKELRLEKPKNDQLKLLLSYSGLALLANVIFFLYQRTDYWLIRYFGMGDAELGNYIQASRIAQMFQLLPGMFAAALFPILSSLKEKKELLLLPLMRITLQLNMILLLMLALAGHYFFPFLFGPSFGDMYTYFLYLIPGILSLTVLSLLSAFFASENLLYVNLYAAAIAMMLLLIGDVLFLKTIGFMTAPIVNSISAFFALIFSFVLFKRRSGIQWSEILKPKVKDYRFIKEMIIKSYGFIHKEKIQ